MSPLLPPVCVASWRNVSIAAGARPAGWVRLLPAATFCTRGSVGPRGVVDRQPRRDRNARGCHASERHGVPMEVGLVDITALDRHRGGAVTSDEATSRVIETDELRSALGGKADLGSEPGPQALAAPSDLGGELVDPNPPSVEPHLFPREGDL